MPFLLFRVFTEILYHFPFLWVCFKTGIPGPHGCSPVLEIRQTIFETVHNNPGNVGGGHCFNDKMILSQFFIHAWPQHFTDITAGRFQGSHDQFSLPESLFLQQVFLKMINNGRSKEAEAEEYDA